MSQNNIANFHNEGIYYPTKTIKLFGDIDTESMDLIISNLHALDKQGGEVTLLLSSEGGDVESGLAIYDAIRAMRNTVRVVAYGGVSSIASIIYQAGDKRLMLPHSYIMIHEAEFDVSGRKENFEAWKKLEYYMEDRCTEILLKKIKEKRRMSKKRLEELCKVDWILLPKEAIKFGLADEIVETY